jgi:guanosine-3',5'-bis(diphosphate) 3'-pyrophosphohydrolase
VTSPLLALAIDLARRAHHDQVDKGGAPYLEHPLRVMAQMHEDTEKMVAVLHDAVEDSALTLEALIRHGFPGDVVDAVDAITKRPGEPYEGYLARVKANPVALRVKIADMTDNMDLGRIPNPTEKDRQRLEKYQRILPELKAAMTR